MSVAANLPLPHKPQPGDGYCLPACVQMVFAYLGISRTQDAIAKTLRLNPPFGTRHSNIKKVASAQIKQASYVASKSGIIGLTRELAGQWARRGVRVNAIAPGWFETEMTAEMFTDERSLRWIRGRDPMGRAGRVDELAGPLLFFASDASSYVTGQVLAVDGGWTIV